MLSSSLPPSDPVGKLHSVLTCGLSGHYDYHRKLIEQISKWVAARRGCNQILEQCPKPPGGGQADIVDFEN